MPTTRGIQRPDQGHNQTVVERRVADLAKRSVGVDLGRTVMVVPFSFAGSLSVSESPRFYPHIATRLVTVHVSLGTAGTSNTVTTIKKNGVALSPTITLGSGVNTATASFYEAMTSDLDYLTVAITTVGSGAKDLTVQARSG